MRADSHSYRFLADYAQAVLVIISQTINGKIIGRCTMALMNCLVCKKAVSSRSLHCLDCGAPIATAKRLRLHALGSMIILIAGSVWLMIAPTVGDVESHLSIAGWLITMACTGYAATKLNAELQVNSGDIDP